MMQSRAEERSGDAHENSTQDNLIPQKSDYHQTHRTYIVMIPLCTTGILHLKKKI